MRRAILLVCLFALPDVVQGQVGPMYGPGEDQLYPSYSGQLYFRPYYGYGGTVVQGVPRAGIGGNVWGNRPDWGRTGSPRRPAGYFYYPNYPSFRYSNPPDIRPQEYVLPPVTRTPYHDPYFEERAWYDEDYDYWGW